jgi:hypothetical protein
VNNYFKAQGQIDNQNQYEEKGADLILDNQKYTNSSRVARHTISYTLTILVLFISSLFSFALAVAEAYFLGNILYSS